MSVDVDQQQEDLKDPSEDVQATQEEVRSAFWMAVERGHTRLDRHWLGLTATGAAAGLDVALGAFGLLVVMQATRNIVLASLTFSIGFIVVVFADSELFTENYLIPLSAVLTGRDSVVRLLRLWGATLVMNLAGGWVIGAILVSGFPDIKQQAIQLSRFYLMQGFGWRSFSAAIFAGALVTLMTWMNSITTSQSTRLFSALIVGYVLALGQMPHCIVSGIEFFIALVGGAPFGYQAALKMIGWMVLGNMVGGVGLAGGLRLAQVAGIELRRRERESEDQPEQDQESVDLWDQGSDGQAGGGETEDSAPAPTGYTAYRRGFYTGEDESGLARAREQEPAPTRLPRVQEPAAARVQTQPPPTHEHEEPVYRSFYKGFEKGFYSPEPAPAPPGHGVEPIGLVGPPAPAGRVGPEGRVEPDGGRVGPDETGQAGSAPLASGATAGEDLPSHHRIFRAIKDSTPSPPRQTSERPDPLA